MSENVAEQECSCRGADVAARARDKTNARARLGILARRVLAGCVMPSLPQMPTPPCVSYPGRTFQRRFEEWSHLQPMNSLRQNS
jgi:hypothetical protein